MKHYAIALYLVLGACRIQGQAIDPPGRQTFDALKGEPLKICSPSRLTHECEISISQIVPSYTVYPSLIVQGSPPAPKPHACGPYQHPEIDGIRINPSGLLNFHCVDDLHTVTEQEWQALQERVKKLEEQRIMDRNIDQWLDDVQGISIQQRVDSSKEEAALVDQGPCGSPSAELEKDGLCHFSVGFRGMSKVNCIPLPADGTKLQTFECTWEPKKETK